MQTSHNNNLFMVSCNSKYAIYLVETEAIKARKGEGVLLGKEQEEEKKAMTLIH
jgi:hypothetical protein